MIKNSLYMATLDDVVDGVDSISFVKDPAIGVNFYYTAENDCIIIDAPVLLANKEIFQMNEKYGEHYIFFLPEIVKQIMDRFGENRNSYNFNVEHSLVGISGVHFIESYQVDYSKGLKPLNTIGNVHDGSWVAKIKVKNQDLIEKITSGEVKGLSITGAFSFSLIDSAELIKMKLS